MTAEEKWEQFKKCIQESLQEHVPLKPRKEHKKWMTQDLLDLMGKKEENLITNEKYTKNQID